MSHPENGFPRPLDGFATDYPDLDVGIAGAVEILMSRGVETYESCEGGEGHAYAEPTVAFHGKRDQGWRAVWAAQERGLSIAELRRVWRILDGEPTGPHWEIAFSDKVPRC
jgi:hypothetical protein